MKFKFTLIAIATAMVGIIGGPFASEFSLAETNDAVGIAEAQVNLKIAVAAAEQHVGGKAVTAEFERDKGQWIFDIKVINRQAATDVKVDAVNGRIFLQRRTNRTRMTKRMATTDALRNIEARSG